MKKSDIKEKPQVSSLKASPNNPRKITDPKLAMLKKSMQEFGDLSGIVFNIKTKHLIGGHQRIKNLDPSWPIQKRPHNDKVGTVAMGMIKTPFGDWSYREVNWPEKKETLANIAANKHGGEFDLPELKKIMINLSDDGADMDLTGFDAQEIKIMNFSINSANEDPEEKSKNKKSGDIVICPKCGFNFTVLEKMNDGQ